MVIIHSEQLEMIPKLAAIRAAAKQLGLISKEMQLAEDAPSTLLSRVMFFAPTHVDRRRRHLVSATKTRANPRMKFELKFGI